MTTVHDLSAAQLAALLAFHADAGVEWLLEDEPVDQRAAFERQRAAAQQTAPAAAARAKAATGATALPAPQAGPRNPAPTLPGEHAVNEARFVAESALTLDELKTAVANFDGCNLKASARSSILASGSAEAGIMVIGPAPSADDDREGLAFSGRAGQLLDRMLAAIGLMRDGVLLTHVLPWRPPGDRPPSQPEAAICRPFIERQIALAEPRHILLLGNFTARFFFGGNETIHGLRGQWRPLQAGGHAAEAIASLHPQDLMAAPASKALAWRDLCALRRRISGEIA